MHDRMPSDRDPWLLASVALAIALLGLQFVQMTQAALILLNALPLALLAIFVLQRGHFREARLLSAALALQAIGWALWFQVPVICLNALLISHLICLSMFLSRRQHYVDVSGRAAALALTLGTPILCYVAAERAGVGVPLFLGLALGGMAAAAWVSTLRPRQSGAGAALVAAGVILQIAASAGNFGLSLVAWSSFYIGNLIMTFAVLGSHR